MSKRGKAVTIPERFVPSAWPMVVGARSAEELAKVKQRAEREARTKGATIEWVSHTARGDVRRRSSK